MKTESVAAVNRLLWYNGRNGGLKQIDLAIFIDKDSGF
jgi:hypothetical protein